MMRFLPQLCVTLLVVSLLCGGCGDDDVDDHQIIPRTEPPTADATELDTQIDDGGVDVSVDPRCEGRPPGAVCELSNATGVCAEGRCRFLSCTAGFRNCDDDLQTGCETDITDANSCGACGVSCAAPETCQLGRAGWLCSVSPVCPAEQFDLDGRIDNGCEWRLGDDTDGAFDPTALQPDVSVQLPSGSFAVAGTASQDRLVASTDGGAAEPISVGAHTDGAFAARDAAMATDPTDQALVAVAWPDAVTLSRPQGSRDSDGVFSYACTDGQTDSATREFLAVTGSSEPLIYAATTHEVLRLDVGSDCAAAAPEADRQICGEPAAVFGAAEYLETFGLGDSSGDCGGCLPDGSSCERMRPIGLEYLDERGELVVFTRSGFFVLEPDADGWNAGARFEADEPDGVRLVAGAAHTFGDLLGVALLAEDGMLYRLTVDPSATQDAVRPAAPAVGLAASAQDESVALKIGPEAVVLINDDRDIWLVGPLDRSARIEQVPRPDAFLGDGRVVFGTGSSDSPGRVSALYFGVNRYHLRAIDYAPDSR